VIKDIKFPPNNFLSIFIKKIITNFTMSNPHQRDNPTNVIEHFTTEAWRLYHAGQTERAFDLAREMLANPRLSDYHEARMHMLLSTAKSDSAV